MSELKSLPAIRRYFGGSPILAPTSRVWESGVTFNAAATFVERTPANQKRLDGLVRGIGNSNRDLPDGAVVVHYRARPKSDPIQLPVGSRPQPQ